MPLSDNALDEMVARERERGAPPLTDWDSLSVRLRAEGLIRVENPSRFVSRRWMQVAAGLALAVGGAAVGRMSAGASPIPTQSASVAQSSTTTTPQATNASRTSSTEQAFKSPEEAWDALNRAGEEYQRASAYLSASNTEVPMPQSPWQYRTRSDEGSSAGSSDQSLLPHDRISA